MKNLLALSFLAFLMLTAMADANADQVVLTNEDRISGEIISISDGKIQVKTDYAGLIQVDFDKVANLTTERAVHILLLDGKAVTGRIDSISDNMIVVQSADSGAVKVARDRFKAMSPVDSPDAGSAEITQTPAPPAQPEAPAKKTADVPDESKIDKPPAKPKRWSGSVSVGAQLQDGNTDTTDLHFDAKAKRKVPRRELELKFRADYGETEGETDTNKTFGEAKYKVFRSERFYLFGVLNLEHDEMEDLDLRAQFYAGPGYYFIKKERTTLLGELGVGVVGEWVDDEEGYDKTAEPGGWINVEWTQRLCKSMEFFQGLTMYPSFGDFGEYRLHSESTLKAPLGERWVLKLSAIDDYDSDPESDDTENNDFRFITSLGYEF